MTIVKGEDGKMTQPIPEKVSRLPDQGPKVLRVACELAPVHDNPGLFWIGWTRPLASDDFRQLRRSMICWRAPDLDKNGTPGLEEGWRITGDGLEQAAMLGYQILVDGAELPPIQGNFRAGFVDFLETRKASRCERCPQAPGDTPAELAPMLVKFLRPEIAIMGADLREYGPFHPGDVAAVPFLHATVFIANGAAEMYGG